ncbi:RluA family pseudouridine synthase [Akkermansia glycaniphila]|uniref:Rna pseudouridylate synthase n=1 Tax=Akkermansia glycaniphila TaxID=1679444 RepID=A0A1H6MIT5_9BACT|nr:RluA family pseudouridine synthase [Akkermansia glycaniphila]SEI01574.1 rna pseudouridylate synthase [Akkermansia glycaniphila]
MKYDMPIAVEADFSVLYETEDFLAVSKAAPLLAHPTGEKNEPTLWHGLRELLAYELATGGQISLVNRLDRETSGITLVAKTLRAARELGKAMQRRELHKEYMALVLGHPAWRSCTCEEPILSQSSVRPSRIHVKQCCHPDGKPCFTSFRVLKTIPATRNLPAMSLIRCIPRTGRMHQIRVHLAHLGHPILGDKIYGFDETCYLDFIAEGWTPDMHRRLHLPRHALHSCALSFPWRDETVRIHAPLPEDMAALCRRQ